MLTSAQYTSPVRMEVPVLTLLVATAATVQQAIKENTAMKVNLNSTVTWLNGGFGTEW